MSVSSTSSTSSTALTGLSGYDFTGVIQAMVQNYELPLTQMQNQESTVQQQQSAWQDINTRLSALNDTIAALESSDTWSATTATSSNTSYVNATGGPGALAGNYTVAVANTATAETVVSAATDDSTFQSAMGSNNYSYNSTAGTSTWDFAINGKNIAVKSSSSGDPSLTDIANSINSAQVGVSASVIQVGSSSYRLSVTSNSTGQANAISFTDPNGTLSALGLTLDGSGHPQTYDTLSATPAGISQAAKDASFTVNGIGITSGSNKVTTAIPGVTLNLVAPGSSTVTVASDTSTAESAIKSFVSAYNSVQSLISTDLSYDTSTGTAGVLYGDAELENIQSKLREMMGGTFNNPTTGDNILSAVGISTSSDNFGESASLNFDTSKFETAYAANPQSVANLFSASYNGVLPTNGLGGTAVQGLGNTLSAYLNPLIEYGGVLSTINTNYTNQISGLESDISDFQERVTDYQNMLNLKFSNLETILSSLNSQGTSLTNMINSIPSYSSSKS
ncbi:flagellar hook-associated protein 2 [Desulfosporosinus acididurans]|uniref:Flagellar hook-associated protein 2 n=1 Tax=Desulfosporosinus acididurans TaxID=476652 RepID=A0A0J1FRD4_9FIRM|nr:flagellar filament capping protein FliD [Desulfosporosinus acididurans]KLU65877.1 flagellar hook-associated protein 2 [Desulfosporosinus acididurans]